MGGVKVAALYAALGLDKKDYDKGLDDAETRSKGWGSRIGGIFKSAGKAIAIGLAVGIAALAVIGRASLQNAEEQELANERVQAVYGDAAGAVNEWAQANSRAMGVNDDVLQQSLSAYGQWAQNVGMSTEEAASGAQAMATRAEEIARTTGKSFDEVFEALMKGAQGATRGLKTYGIAVSPAAIETEALRLGLIAEGEAMNDAAKAAALQSLILNQTANYTETAAEATDSFAYKQRQMGVMVDEVMDTVGVLFMNLASVILPYVVDALVVVADWVASNMPAIQATFETAIGIVAWVFENVLVPAFQAAAAVIQWVVANVVPPLVSLFQNEVPAATNVVGDIIDWLTTNVIPPLAAAFTWVSENVLPTLVEAFSAVADWVSSNWPTISSVVGQVLGAVATAFGLVRDVIAFIVPIIWGIVEPIARVLFPVIGAAASVLWGAIDLAFKGIGGAFEVVGAVASAVWDAIEDAWRGATRFFRGIWDGIGGVFRGGLNIVVDLINGFLQFLNGFRIDLPRVGVPGTDIVVGGGSIDPFNFGLLPRFASGGRMTHDGLAWVGEHGPELVSLPRGANVHSAADSRGMLGGKVVVELRDPDGAIARGGYSQRDIERAVEAAVNSLADGMRGRSLRMGAPS